MMNVCVVFCVFIVFFVGCGSERDPRLLAYRRFQVLPTQVNCYDVPTLALAESTQTNQEWRMPRHLTHMNVKSEDAEPAETIANNNAVQRRKDRYLQEEQDVVREHAKLVQDINGLSQVIFYSPHFDDPRDYEDSIFHEIIESYSTTTPKPPTTTFRVQIPVKSKPTGIPVILAGGSKKNKPVRTQSLVRNKQTINLIGSSSSPKLVTKQPYSFVGKPSAAPPYSFGLRSTTPVPMRVCMPSLPLRRPTLWERLVSFFPRLVK